MPSANCIISSVVAGTVPGPVSGLKLAALGNGTYAIAFTGMAAPNGTLYNEALAETPVSTGLIYTNLFVRHWDTCKHRQQDASPFRPLFRVNRYRG